MVPLWLNRHCWSASVWVALHGVIASPAPLLLVIGVGAAAPCAAPTTAQTIKLSIERR
jgi:hypothetical protein